MVRDVKSTALGWLSEPSLTTYSSERFEEPIRGARMAARMVLNLEFPVKVEGSLGYGRLWTRLLELRAVLEG